MNNLLYSIKEQIKGYEQYGSFLTDTEIKNLHCLTEIYLNLDKIQSNSDKNIDGTDIDDYIRNLNDRFMELLDTREHYQAIKDQPSKTKLLNDIKEFTNCMHEIYKGIWESSIISEERQYLQQLMPRLQQLK